MAVETDLRFGLLGALAVERGGEPVDVGHPKQRAVLALLAVNANRSLTTEQIADALWGDRPPQSAAATLQVYVSNLRRTLEPDRAARAPARVLRTTGGGYELSVDPEAIDVLRFGRLVADASEVVERQPQRARELLAEALALWHGPALADFQYDEFAQREIVRLDDLRVTAQELRFAADLALGRSDGLITEIDALVRQHPLRERLRAHQMLALYRAGRQTEALAAYRELDQALREELGLDPGHELRDLQLAILEHDPDLRWRPPPPLARDELGRAPALVGRGAEHRRLGAALERAARGRGSVVLVEGEAGIGETRLLEFLHHEAQAGGVTTAFARCVEVGGTPPFWPWTQLVRQLDPPAVAAAAGNYVSHLAPLLPAAVDRPPTPGSPLFRVAEGLIAALQSLGRDAPVLLILDDLYSSDPDSLSLLTLLAAELDRLPVVVVGSHRGHDLGPAHPLTETITSLLRFAWVERVELGHFDVSEVAELVRTVTGADVDGAVATAIHARTNGNAFYAIELTKLLGSQNLLDADSATRAVPGSIRDVVGTRVRQLSVDTVRLLRAGAVAGREFELADLAAILQLDVETMITAVDEAVAAGLLRETERPGTYRFAHVIVVDAVLDSLGSVRLAQIHQSLADGIERDRHDAPEAWIDIAHHRTEAIPLVGPLGAIDALARAGRHAMTSDAIELAERLFERRRGLVDGLAESGDRARLEVDALLDLVRVWTWAEGYHAERIGDATTRLWELTGLRQGSATLDTSAPIVADDPILSSVQARFSFAMVRGDLGIVEPVVEAYLGLAASCPDPMVVLGANLAALIAAVHAGRADEAVSAAEHAASALDVLDPRGANVVMLPLGQQAARVTHHAFAGWAYYLVGDRDRAETELRTARSWCDRLDHAFTTGFCVAVEGIVATMDDSAEWVADAVAWGRRDVDHGQFGLFEVWHDLLDTWADGMRGGAPIVAADRFRATITALGDQGAWVMHTLYWAMTAQLEGRAGRFDRVLEATDHGIAHAETFGERFWYPELERLAAAAHGALGRADEQSAAHRRAVDAAKALGVRPLLDRLATRSG